MTDDQPLAFTGGERNLFLVSLRAFSDECEAPQLTPTCPFYEKTAQGPSCGEQCRDLLAQYHDHLPSAGAINFGDGLVAIPRRRRPRRGPEPSGRPFDAGAIRLRDKDRPTDSRHTVSLFSELSDLLRTPPHLAEDEDERSYMIRACIDELGRRGFERRDLMYGAARLVAAAMVSMMVASMLLEHAKAAERERSGLELEPPWLVVRNAWSPANEEQDLPQKLVRFVSAELPKRLTLWNVARSIDQLIAWQAPTVQFLFGPMDAAELDKTRRGSWLLERFTKTYLVEWPTYALDLEWGYMHSAVEGCNDPRQMALRRIDVNDLAKELAHRAVEQRKGETEEAGAIDPSAFTLIAVDHLQARRYEAAAAIYEGVHRLRPTDPVVLNNLGFCLLPLDLDRAIGALEQSMLLAPKARAITHANLAFGCYRKGDTERAAELAEICRNLTPEQNVWLWEVGLDGELELRTGLHTTSYAQALLDRIATPV